MAKREDRRGLVKAGDLLKDEVSMPDPPADPPPIPTESQFANPQLSLFQDFLYNRTEERENLSNAVDLWDCVPRYSISRQSMNKTREGGRFLETHTASFQYRDRTYTCTVSPARVKDLEGVQRDYYPSANEELVEDALRKLAAEQLAGFFDKPNYRSGVVFTLYALREELAKRGHTRSYQEIVLALNILAKSIIEIRATGEKGEVLAISPYLQSLVAVSRHTLKDDPKAKWAVQFHPFVTGSIDQVTYRQFNYHLMMSHKTQIARWLHKQLVLKYTFAELSRSFEMRYSTIKRDSGLLSGYARERAAIDALETAFQDLKEQDILSAYERQDLTGPRKKLLDVTFKIWPSLSFVKEVKAANKRLIDGRKGTLPVGITGRSK
ncbi:MAG: replication protein [Acidobacteria bacterium]|nr:replication protein [Acidobacteriota bacterium]